MAETLAVDYLVADFLAVAVVEAVAFLAVYSVVVAVAASVVAVADVAFHLAVAVQAAAADVVHTVAEASVVESLAADHSVVVLYHQADVAVVLLTRLFHVAFGFQTAFLSKFLTLTL